MKKQALLIFLFIFFGASYLDAQKAILNENCYQAYKRIVCLQLDSADFLLKKEIQHHDNAFVPYLRNYSDFISLFVSQNKELYEELKSTKTDKFRKVEELKETSPYRKWMLGNMYLQWAVLKIMFGDYISAVFDFNRAYSLIEDNIVEHPDFHLNNLSASVLKIIIGLVPEQYDWFLNLLSMEGDVEQGKKQLQHFLSRCKTDSTFEPYHYEALFYASFIEMNIYPNEKQLDIYKEEAAQIDDSVLLITFLRLNLYMRTGENQKALNLFNEVNMNKKGALPFAYLNYLHAECLLRAQNWQSAISTYDLFLDHFKGKNYVIDTWRKKAWAATMLEDTALFYHCMDKALVSGSSKIDIDKEAFAEAKAKQIPNKELLLSRILFDGGYYTDALHILSSLETSGYSNKDELNYKYRLARVYDQLDSIDWAKKYYKLTIIEGAGSDSYFAANASLKLGGIYEMERNYLMAKEAYSACLEMDYKQYRNSINRRASEGLKRVSK